MKKLYSPIWASGALVSDPGDVLDRDQTKPIRPGPITKFSLRPSFFEKPHNGFSRTRCHDPDTFSPSSSREYSNRHGPSQVKVFEPALEKCWSPYLSDTGRIHPKNFFPAPWSAMSRGISLARTVRTMVTGRSAVKPQAWFTGRRTKHNPRDGNAQNQHRNIRDHQSPDGLFFQRFLFRIYA